jgi:hypothetical protein
MSETNRAIHESSQAGETTLPRRLQIAAALGNLVVGAVEAGVSLAGSAFSGVSDGVHNLIDSVTYWKQFENITGKLTEAQREQNRKVTYCALSIASLGLAAKAGFDLTTNHEADPHPLHAYAAGASLALNTILLGGMVRSARVHTMDSRDKRDIYKHFLGSDIPSSAIAVFGAIMHRYHMPNVEQIAAIGSGILSAWLFRPTRANLHHHHTYGHSHEHHET